MQTDTTSHSQNVQIKQQHTKKNSKIVAESTKEKNKGDIENEHSISQTGSQQSISEYSDSNQNDSDSDNNSKQSVTSADKDANEESDYDSDEGFQEELSSDEDETFIQKFMGQTQNQIAFSIPNIEERGRLKNKIEPELPAINKSYSLLPDMATGWRPKILTEQIPCPIPLYFGDKNLNMIANRLQRFQKYPVVYFGQKPKTSFDVHRAYCGKDTYSFKFSSILFNEDVLKQFKIKIQDETDTMQQIDNLRIFAGMNPDFKKNSLQFDSFFEGGNLDIAVKLSDIEYDLYMRPDTNTRGHQSWFYFKISNAKANQTIRFNICNFQKKRSLYTRGLRPFVLSMIDKEKFGQVWQQGGSSVYYSKRKNIKYDMLVNSSKPYYQMTFDYTFEYDGDEVYFASLPPYSYSEMKSFLQSDIITSNKQYVREVKLCRSLGGLFIPQINITDYSSDEIALEQRKTIIISARIHPGESISTYIAQGAIQYLLSDDEEVKQLRKNIIFRIIPILNVDGVVVGNYRTSFSGLDLNRQFSQNDRTILPEIYHLKRIVRKDHNMNNLIAFFDIHGHSVRKNCFIYGPYFSKNELNYYKSKFIPYLFSLRSDTFRYKSCKFTNQNYKRETARLVFHKQFGIFNTFTLEASFGLKDTKNDSSPQPFKITDYLQIGKELIQTLSDYRQKMEVFNKVRENQDQIKIKIEMEKAMRSPVAKDLVNNQNGRAKSNSLYLRSNGVQQMSLLPNNNTSSNNSSAVKSRKGSLNIAITERFQEDQSFNNIKTLIKGIKEKHGGKKYENESDKYSDVRVDSEDSEEDFTEEQRKGINENITTCVQNFKKQFVKSDDNSLQNTQKELVIVLNHPIEEDEKKKKKKKKNLNTKREEIKLSKQYKVKFQEDDDDSLLQCLFDETISNVKKNPNKSINKFIKEHYKEEDDKLVQSVHQQIPRNEGQFGSGSKLLPIVHKWDHSNQLKQEQNRNDISSALSGSVQLQTSQTFSQDKNMNNNIFGKFYNDTDMSKNRNDKQDKSMHSRERSLTPLNMSKGSIANSSMLNNNNVNNSGIYQKNFQNRAPLKMNIICEKSDTIKQLNDKIKNQNDILKSIDIEKSTSIFKQNGSIQSSVIFEKDINNSLFNESKNMNNSEVSSDYGKGFSVNIHNSNKNPFYINNPVIKYKGEHPTRTSSVLNSSSMSNDVKTMQNLGTTFIPKRDSSIFDNQTNDSYPNGSYKDICQQDDTTTSSQQQQQQQQQNCSIGMHAVLQNSTNQPKVANSYTFNTVHMPKLNAQQRNTSQSKDQVNRKRSRSQRKDSSFQQNNLAANINYLNNQDLSNQLPPRDYKTEKKNMNSAKTPILNSLKSSNNKRRDSSLDLQVRPFCIQTQMNNPSQKQEEVGNENEIAFDSRLFKQYQAFQVRKNGSKFTMQARTKNNNVSGHQPYIH